MESFKKALAPLVITIMWETLSMEDGRIAEVLAFGHSTDNTLS